MSEVEQDNLDGREKFRRSMQNLIDEIGRQGFKDRSRYHLTLGGLIEALEKTPPNMKVLTDTGLLLGNEHSYRGYYSDLAFEAFEPGDPTGFKTASELLAICKGALGSQYGGYKGDLFKMEADTPLWVSKYGHCSGIAIIAKHYRRDRLILITKSVS